MFADLETELAEFRDLGSNVTVVVFVERGRFQGGTAPVERRYGVVATWAGGLVERVKNYADVDEARAAAERLAEERE